MNKTQKKPINLESYLEKVSKLNKLLEVCWEKKLSKETRENIKWYCDYRVHQYYKQYKLYLKND